MVVYDHDRNIWAGTIFRESQAHNMANLFGVLLDCDNL